MKIFLWGKPDFGIGHSGPPDQPSLRVKLARQLRKRISDPELKYSLEHSKVYDTLWVAFNMGRYLELAWGIDAHPRTVAAGR